MLARFQKAFNGTNGNADEAVEGTYVAKSKPKMLREKFITLTFPQTQNSTSSLSRISRSKKAVPTYAGYGSLNRDHHRSAPATPHRSDPFSTFAGDLRTGLSNSDEDFAINAELNSNFYHRNDLLLAADSVTSAMSSLVKELNTGTELSTFKK